MFDIGIVEDNPSVIEDEAVGDGVGEDPQGDEQDEAYGPSMPFTQQAVHEGGSHARRRFDGTILLRRGRLHPRLNGHPCLPAPRRILNNSHRLTVKSPVT